jgi:hypothetical protein
VCLLEGEKSHEFELWADPVGSLSDHAAELEPVGAVEGCNVRHDLTLLEDFAAAVRGLVRRGIL